MSSNVVYKHKINFQTAQPGFGENAHGTLQAIVQYDYEAMEDNELNLLEGQIISDVDTIDEGIPVSYLHVVS